MQAANEPSVETLLQLSTQENAHAHRNHDESGSIRSNQRNGNGGRRTAVATRIAQATHNSTEDAHTQKSHTSHQLSPLTSEHRVHTQEPEPESTTPNNTAAQARMQKEALEQLVIIITPNSEDNCYLFGRRDTGDMQIRHHNAKQISDQIFSYEALPREAGDPPMPETVAPYDITGSRDYRHTQFTSRQAQRIQQLERGERTLIAWQRHTLDRVKYEEGPDGLHIALVRARAALHCARHRILPYYLMSGVRVKNMQYRGYQFDSTKGYPGEGHTADKAQPDQTGAGSQRPISRCPDGHPTTAPGRSQGSGATQIGRRVITCPHCHRDYTQKCAAHLLPGADREAKWVSKRKQKAPVATPVLVLLSLIHFPRYRNELQPIHYGPTRGLPVYRPI